MFSPRCRISIVCYMVADIPVNGTQHYHEMRSAPTTVSATGIIRPLQNYYQAETNYQFGVNREINNRTGGSA